MLAVPVTVGVLLELRDELAVMLPVTLTEGVGDGEADAEGANAGRTTDRYCLLPPPVVAMVKDVPAPVLN